MSRNARIPTNQERFSGWLVGLLLSFAAGEPAIAAETSGTGDGVRPAAHVLIVHDPEATEAFQPQPEKVHAMVRRAITNLTRQATVAAAWRTLISTQDMVGLKVYSSPGSGSGTRPAVVAGIVESLLEANIPARRIIIWDKHLSDLRKAGFLTLAANHGVRAAGSVDEGYDEKNYYDKEFLGYLLWDDLEFGKKGPGVGRKSFVSNLVSKQITKIINITPLLNHHTAGVTGNLYSLTEGSVDNFYRFETDNRRLAEAVPEIYALPSLGDRVALNVVDALICQYQGGQSLLLHYSKALNELRLSTDAVALDVLSLQELDRQRQLMSMRTVTNNIELYQNASLLDLGTSDPSHIQVERLP